MSEKEIKGIVFQINRPDLSTCDTPQEAKVKMLRKRLQGMIQRLLKKLRLPHLTGTSFRQFFHR